MSRNGQERRRIGRAPFDGWVELRVDGRSRRARGVDLSRDGLGLALPPPHPRGSRLVTEFALPGISPPLAIESEPAWTDTARERLGLRFRALDPALAELVARFVSGRLV